MTCPLLLWSVKHLMIVSVLLVHNASQYYLQIASTNVCCVTVCLCCCKGGCMFVDVAAVSLCTIIIESGSHMMLC